MGSANSVEASQTDEGKVKNEDERPIYKLVDMHGSGLLINIARNCKQSGSNEILESYLEQEVTKYLYSSGKGRLVPVAELVTRRNKERNAKLGAFKRKKGKGKSGPNILDEFDQNQADAGDLKKALKLLDGGGKGGKSESKYRDVCWNLDERGTMGENLLAICLLQGSELHNFIAKKLIKLFPKLINDICTSEEYYGLSPLHMAIINQDAEFAALLLKYGADLNQRCYGAFFCAEDQKAGRTDSVEHEYVELPTKTNYTGSMYFGEYPLSFAVCMDQFDMLRLIMTKRANLNAQDTNGNTALHLCVIHQKPEMMDALLAAGANIRLSNKQNLTPLTLAAKLAKKTIFEKILQMECEKIWTYGYSRCLSYPLAQLDTIDEETGQMNENSALYLVVYGETVEHLEVMDGLLEELLEQKWKSYGKKLWMNSLIMFLIFYTCFTLAYMLRPSSATTEHLTHGLIDDGGDTLNKTEVAQLGWNSIETQCHLRMYSQWPWYYGWFRLCCEGFTVFCILIQLIGDIGDIRRIGFQKWFNFLKAFPAKLMYKMSFIFILMSIPCRLLCGVSDIFLLFDNTMAIISVLLVTQHFLYYLRAIPFIGPFVLMIYTIIATDLVRFFTIYSIFLAGFSQSFYIIFNSCEREANIVRLTDPARTEFTNVMSNPVDSLIRTFIMTIGEFSVLYREMAACDVILLRELGKVLFLIFETFVSILQFNLLIAMMTRTYETIFLTRKEWKRQWAQVILMLEMGLSPAQRKMYLMKYSRPTGMNKKRRSYVVILKGDGKTTELDELQAREFKEEQRREERKQLLKIKQREHEVKQKALAALGTKMRVPVEKKKRVLRQSTIGL